MDLAIEIWNEHIEVFVNFDLVCHNGHSLEYETKSNALFNALVTLDRMYGSETRLHKMKEIDEAVTYLKGSKYYSESNKNSNY